MLLLVLLLNRPKEAFTLAVFHGGKTRHAGVVKALFITCFNETMLTHADIANYTSRLPQRLSWCSQNFTWNKARKFPPKSGFIFLFWFPR